MKRFSLALRACADTMCRRNGQHHPTNTNITGAGPFTWTYDALLSIDQNVNSGNAPGPSATVPHMNVNFAGFFTIYDFAGYINGSCAGPMGWTCTAQNAGFTPDDVFPLDNPNIVNITWAYTSTVRLTPDVLEATDCVAGG